MFTNIKTISTGLGRATGRSAQGRAGPACSSWTVGYADPDCKPVMQWDSKFSKRKNILPALSLEQATTALTQLCRNVIQCMYGDTLYFKFRYARPRYPRFDTFHPLHNYHMTSDTCSTGRPALALYTHSPPLLHNNRNPAILCI